MFIFERQNFKDKGQNFYIEADNNTVFSALNSAPQ